MKLLLSALQGIPEFQQLLTALDSGRSPAAVSGLQPVQRACVGAAAAQAAGRPAVFLCGDEREARQLAGDLTTLLGTAPVLLLSRGWRLRPGAAVS